MTFHVPNQHRLRKGAFASDNTNGNNGAFFVPVTRARTVIKVIASDGMGWEHVSASLPDRCPTWSEMSALKSIFWDDEDCVVQFHPPRSEYVNNHPFCLHMWRSTEMEFPLPDSLLVGIKGVSPVQVKALLTEQS